MSQKKLKLIRKQVVEEISKPSIKKNRSIRQVIKENWKFLVILSIGILLLFFNALGGDFVSDDYATIPLNSNIKDIGYTLKTTPNLVNLSNTFIANIFGIESSLAFHLFNVLILISLCVLSFIFLEMIVDKRLAMMTVSLFAVHPIHVEAVTWISGRPYSLFALFTLSVIISILYFFDTKKYKYLYVAIVGVILAYKSDGARTLGLIFILPFCLWFAGSFVKVKINWKKLLPISFVVIVIMTIILWPSIIGRINVVNSGYNISESIFYNPFFQYPTAVAKYLQLLFLPFDLTLYHTMFILPTWLNWLIFLSYLANVFYFFFKDKRISFALIFIFIAAAASMSPVKVAWLVAERYLFLGSLGFCLFLAIVLQDVFKQVKYISYAIFILLLVFFSVRTFLRNIDWQTNHNLWVNTCQVSPNSHNAWNNIGDDYDKLKQYDNAIKGFTQSTIVKTNYADAFHNRANIFYKIGRLDLARDSYNTAISFSPGLHQTYLSLVQIDLTERKLDLALEHAKKALELQPNNPQAAYVLGIVYAESGQIDEAKKIMTAVTQNYPGFTLASDALKKINEIKK